MVYNNLALLMKSILIFAGVISFTTCFAMSVFGAQTGLVHALLRGLISCLVITFLVRMMLVAMFRAYLVQSELRHAAAQQKAE
jgi:hypothetical protein